MISRILHMTVEEIGEVSLGSKSPVEFTTGCAVFAESEAVSRIAEGALPADILAGVHKAMASKIANLVTRVGLVPDCVVTGGGAKDIGLVRTLESGAGQRDPHSRRAADHGSPRRGPDGAELTRIFDS